ncbi:MAG: extracellular solute-binding protein [Oscillospiraceae bacterium]|nr:extracellular solute-binding protein [Oscillospiraceae bacterium]
MKKILALVMALCMIFALAACGQQAAPAPAANDAPAAEAPAAEAPAGATEISLWTYPIGKWGDEATVKALTDAFTAETGIAVKVEYLTYADGDDKVNTAITAKQAPDLVMEGPERLVSNWGANGYMVDISDLFDDTDKSEINAAALAACFAPNGAAYEYPLVMTAHCMGINYNAFVEAGADQYINKDTHTWTTEQFFQAVQALYDHFGGTVGAVYCTGQGGDQGTRALVNNLYGGTFTNDEHTAYTWDDPLNIKALKALYDQDGIDFDASIAGGDEIANFYNGIFKMAFCWNIAQQLNPNSADTGAGLTLNGDEIVFMAFPSEDGTAKLQGGIWGFGIFDNGDQTKIDAAKQFIKYMCDSEHTADAVRASNFFAARSAAEGTDLSGVWADNEIMNEYTKLMPMLGDYYQVTTNWAAARTAWWNMLQQVGASDGSEAAISAAVADFCGQANNG